MNRGGRQSGGRPGRRGFGGRGRGGGGGFRGRGRGGGFGGSYEQGEPDEVIELGYYTHPCEDDLIIKCTIDKIPYFNAPIYFENKQQIGKVDEIFGPIRDYYVSVKLLPDTRSSSIPIKQKFYIDPHKLLPLQRFLPRPPGSASAGRAAHGGRGRQRGGAGGFRGGRGGNYSKGPGRGGGFRGRGSGGFGGGGRGRDGQSFRNQGGPPAKRMKH